MIMLKKATIRELFRGFPGQSEPVKNLFSHPYSNEQYKTIIYFATATAVGSRNRAKLALAGFFLGVQSLPMPQFMAKKSMNS